MATATSFTTVSGNPIWKYDDGSYGCYGGVGGMDIDGDGAGGRQDNDLTYQPETTLKNPDGTSLNSLLDRGIVIPEFLAEEVPGIVMGCQARVTDVLAGIVSAAVAFDLGPDTKWGEATIALANFFKVPSSPRTGGTTVPRFFYQFWPGQAALVLGKQYHLQKL
jgi:hypothetical protein